jgi:hydroxymethylbilane synthase
MRSIVVGTRGSPIALAQARWVVSRLKEQWPDNEFRLHTVSTKGAVQGERGSRGAELQAALIAQKIDIAIHQLRDLPFQPTEDLELASIPRRLEARDALVGRSGFKSVTGLPQGARVGVSSALRRALLHSYRPDLNLLALTGDIDDRLEALGAGEFDAIVLPAGDLQQLEMRHRIDEIIPVEIILPAPAQGAMALEVRADDDIANEVAYSLQHRPSDDRVTAERAFLEGVKGVGKAVGALATLGGDGTLSLEGCVASPDGEGVIRASIEGDPEEAEDLGFELAQDVLSRGGAALLEVK